MRRVFFFGLFLFLLLQHRSLAEDEDSNLSETREAVVSGDETLTERFGSLTWNDNTNFSDTITSRLYNWKIKGNDGDIILVTVKQFKLALPINDSCQTEYLKTSLPGTHIEITWIPEDPGLTILGTDEFCDPAYPPENYGHIMFYGSEMDVSLLVARDADHGPMQINYQLVSAACHAQGITLMGPYGAFASAGYPAPYPETADCRWNIQSPGEKDKIYLEIVTRVESPSDTNCTDDYLLATDYVSGRQFRFCDHDQHQAVLLSNNITVQFVTDGDSLVGPGFYVDYMVYSVSTECGGATSLGSSIITSPFYPLGYLDPDTQSTNCAWTILGLRGQHQIYLYFEEFDIHARDDNNECSTDYLRLGDYSDIFCGTELKNQSKVYQGHTMTMTFSASQPVDDISHSGFKMVYYLASVGGGQMMDDHGIIMTPGYLNDEYPSDANYTWTIDAPYKHHRIMMRFNHKFSVEGNPSNCQDDYVEVYDVGLDITTKICGTEDPGTIYATETMIISFRTDYDNETGFGFLAFYEIVGPLDTHCSNSVLEESGHLYSPGFPINLIISGYDYSYCEWKIEGEAYDDILLSYNVFDIAESTGIVCDRDYLDVQPGMGKYCGTSLTGKLHTFKSKAELSFFASSGLIGSFNAPKGFHLTFIKASVACSGQEVLLTKRVGYIKTENWPDTYSGQKNCTWRIKASTLEHISINFTNIFDIESTNNCSTTSDRVVITDVTTGDVTTLCGFGDKPAVQADDEMLVEFITDGDIHVGRGFVAKYEIISDINTADVCHDVLLTGGTGTIESPNFASTLVAPPFRCQYTIQGEYIHEVVLAFNKFNLAPPDDNGICSTDFFEVETYGRFCGDQLQGNITLYHKQQLRITYVRQSHSSYQGVQLLYHLATAGCGMPGILPSTLTADAGMILTPAILSENYDDNENCNWQIQARQHHRIHIVFATLDIEGTPGDCKYDVLIITDHGTEQVYTYCGNIQPEPLNVTTSASLAFRTDKDTNTGLGFLITYVTFPPIETSCGGMLTETRATITNPGYPNSLMEGDYSFCEWSIPTESYENIVIDYTAFNLAPRLPGAAWPCSYDYFTVTSTLPNEFCGDSLRASVETYTTSLNLKYFGTSDNVVQTFPRRFSANYLKAAVACGVNSGTTLTAKEGFLMTPNWPKNYDNQQNCLWHIKGGPNSNVVLDFTLFQTEGTSANCTSDNDILTILDKDTGEETKLCGFNPGSQHYEFGSEIDVTFVTDGDTVSGIGFLFLYRIMQPNVTESNCGPHLFTARTDTISSPMEPFPLFDEYWKCDYTIQGKSSDYILVDFFNFNLPERDQNGECSEAYFTLGHTGMQKYCGSELNKNFTVLHKEIETMQYYTRNPSFFDYGFNFTYFLAGVGCGANKPVTLTDYLGVLVSPGYPGGYPPSSDCEWQIHARPYHRISIAFKMGFQLEVGNDVCNDQDDHVTILDGPDDPNPVFLCGENPLNNTVVTGNVMIVRFIADDDADIGRGFEAAFVVVDPIVTGECSTENIQGIRGRITSPGYSDSLVAAGQDYAFCRWLFQMEPYEVVTIDYEIVNLSPPVSMNEEEESCNSSYIHVVDIIALEDKYSCGTEMTRKIVHYGSFVQLKYFAVSGIDDMAAMGLKGLNAEYSVAAVACGVFEGTDLTADEGNIMTPGYGNAYPSNTHCTWNIKGEDGDKISLEYEYTLFLPPNTDCNSALDTVTIFDTDMGTQNLTLCGHAPATTVEFGSSITVMFASGGDSIQATGFFATYKIQRRAQTCPAPSPCTCSGTAIYCHKLGLTIVPEFEFSDHYTRLLLCNNDIEEVLDNAFRNLPNLDYLGIDNNKLKTVHSKAFNGLSRLEDLILHTNQLQTLTDNVFDTLTKLTWLDLDINRLQTLPDNVFDMLTELSRLSLINNQLQTIPNNVFDTMTKLSTLQLQNNKLTNIPIKSLAKAVGGRKMNRLNLNENPNLPCNIRQEILSNIQTPTYFVFPSPCGEQPTCPAPSPCTCDGTNINCENKGLTTVPDFQFSTWVTWLRIYGNSIESLRQKSFENLPNLKKLYIHNNNLDSIHPEAFNGLSKLEALSLTNNKLRNLPDTVFDPFTKLSQLYLHNNQLTNFPVTSLAKAANGTQMELLNLANNRQLPCDVKQKILAVMEKPREFKFPAKCQYRVAPAV